MPSAAEYYLEKIWKVIRGKDADVPSVPVDVSNLSLTKYASRSATILNGANESEAIDVSNFVGDAGIIIVPAAWTAASIGFKVSSAIGGTYSPLRSDSGAIVQISGIQTASMSAYKIPEAMRGVLYFKVWSQTSGSNVAQLGDRALTILVKG